MFNQKLNPINNDLVALNQEINDLKATFQKITQLSGELIAKYQSFTLKSKEDLVDDVNSMVFRTSIILNKRIDQLEESNDQPSALEAYLNLKSKLLRNQEIFKSRLERIIEKEEKEREKEDLDGNVKSKELESEKKEVKISYKSFLEDENQEKNDLFSDLNGVKFNFQSHLIGDIYQNFQKTLTKTEDFFYQESAREEVEPEIKFLLEEIEKVNDDQVDQNQLMIEKLKLKEIIRFTIKLSKSKNDSLETKKTNFDKITQIIHETLELLAFLNRGMGNDKVNSQIFNLSIKKIIDFWQNYQKNVVEISSEFKNILDKNIDQDLGEIVKKFGLFFEKTSFGFYLVYRSKNEVFKLNSFDKKILLKLEKTNNLNELMEVIDKEIDYVPYFKKKLNFYQKSQFKQKVLASILRTQNPTSTRKIINNLPILDSSLKEILAEKITIFKEEQVEKQQKRMLIEKTTQLLNKISDFLQVQQTLLFSFDNFKKKMIESGVFSEDDRKNAKEIYRQLRKDYQKQEIDYVNLLLTLNNLNLENPELIKKSHQLIEVEHSLNEFKNILKSYAEFF